MSASYVRCQTCGNTAVREPRVSEFITRHVIELRHSVIVREADDYGEEIETVFTHTGRRG